MEDFFQWVRGKNSTSVSSLQTINKIFTTLNAKMNAGQLNQYGLNSGYYYITYNASHDFPDVINDGKGTFTIQINQPRSGIATLAYNQVNVVIEVKSLYKKLYTPYLNAGIGNNKYRLCDLKYCFVRNDYSPSIKNWLKTPILKQEAIASTAKNSQNIRQFLTLGPAPTFVEVPPLKDGNSVEWNKDYTHHYVGPKWILDENQSYAEYYARKIYWYESNKEADITTLLSLSRIYHGKIIGEVSIIDSENNTYSNLLISLLNYFSKKDTNQDTREWFISASDNLNSSTSDHNLYGCKIICDDNTRGLVIEIPITRRGPVGRLFLPFINPNEIYTPTKDRCDFDHFLWYFIPWEKNNALRFLMLTDCEITNIKDNKVKARIATRRGHTRDDMPDMIQEDLDQLDCFWGYGYHYRLDANRLFDGGVTIKIPQLATFDRSEETLFKLIYEQTGVLFPIDNNTISYSSTMGSLVATITFTGTRSSVLFLPNPIKVTILDDGVNLFTLFGRDNTKLIRNPIAIKEQESSNDLNRSIEVPLSTIIDLTNLTYGVNLSRDNLVDELKLNYDMLKLFKAGDLTQDLPEVQVKYLTNIFKLYVSFGYFGYYTDERLIPDNLLVNLNQCEVIYNGLNTSECAGDYTKLSGNKNLLVLKPNHGFYTLPFTRYLVLSYED